MKILKELEKRLYGKTMVMFALFECPSCGIKLERPKSNGIKTEKCRECSLVEKHKKMSITMTKHGFKYTKLYSIWNGMKDRVLNSKSKSFINYGGRGILICDEWKNDFVSFRDWSINNGYEDGLSIERIDVNGNYESNNCMWISKNNQSYNKTNTVLLPNDILAILQMKIDGKSFQEVRNKFKNINYKSISNHYHKKDNVEKEMEKIKDYQRELNETIGH